MTDQEAVNLAQLWKAGKMIGGDPYEVSDVLVGMVEKLLEKENRKYYWTEKPDFEKKGN